MALAQTGLTANTPKNLIIDAATIFTDFKYEAAGGFSGTSLGATSGGVKVAIEVPKRKIEVDGAAIMDVKGLLAVESGKCVITAPLKEFTAANLARSINGEIKDALATEAPAGYKKVTSRRYIDDAAYTASVGVVGRLAGTGEPVIFVAHNVIATNSMELDFKDGEEAVIEQELTAHASIDQVNAGVFPWEVFFPGEPPIIP